MRLRARHSDPDKTIVTMLCDYANRYQSRLFNPEFLRVEGPADTALDGVRAATSAHFAALRRLSPSAARPSIRPNKSGNAS